MDEHGLIWRAQALDAGVSERQIEAAIREGHIQLVIRGAYVHTARLPSDDGERKRELYRLRCIAAAVGLAGGNGSGDRVVSHGSAAAVNGLELLLPDLSSVHLTNGRLSGGNVLAGRTIHTGTFTEDDLVVVDGVTVTSLARTAVDVALSLNDFARILTVFDSALRAGVAREELERRLAVPRHRVGLARSALAQANGLSDNPGESWSRAQMIEDGLPVPLLQSKYRLEGGHIAICDYDWEGKAVGEFDGFGKYRREKLRPGMTPEDALAAEKIREDRLRDRGLGVIRWWWEHLRAKTLTAHLRRNFARYGIEF